MAKPRGDKHQIHAENQAITMKFDKTLMYVNIMGPIKWDLDNLYQIFITSYHPWDPAYTNDLLEVSVILPSDNNIDNNLYSHLCQMNAAGLQLYHDYSESEVNDMLMCINNQVQRHAWPINTIYEDPAYD